MKKQSKSLITLFLICFPMLGLADVEISESLEGLSPEEKAWLLDDSNLDAMTVASESLIWSNKASKNNYWLKNSLKINPKSIQTGWVEFSQCHYQLDPVPKIEVTYNQKNTRNLKVISYQKMESATAFDSEVVLTNVSRGAQICIQGESQTLISFDNGFSIQRGPYMRKFLDGYYPMIVEENIELNSLNARLVKQTPINPKAFQKVLKRNPYHFKFAFEGQLKPHYEFLLIKK